MIAIFKREIKAYLYTPMGYVYMSLFLVLSGFFFIIGYLFLRNPRFAMFLQEILFIFLFTVPILTMRIFSDDRKQNADRLLYTSPLRVSQIVLGKFFAALFLFTLTLGITFFYLVLISFHGSVDFWESLSGYLGFFLIGSVFVAIGLFVAVLAESQVITAIITFCVLLSFYLIESLSGGIIPKDITSGMIFSIMVAAGISGWLFFYTKNIVITVLIGLLGMGFVAFAFFVNKNIFIGIIYQFIIWISILKRFKTFSMGIIKLTDVVYYISLSSFFIYMTIRFIEKKRWS